MLPPARRRSHGEARHVSPVLCSAVRSSCPRYRERPPLKRDSSLLQRRTDGRPLRAHWAGAIDPGSCRLCSRTGWSLADETARCPGQSLPETLMSARCVPQCLGGAISAVRWRAILCSPASRCASATCARSTPCRGWPTSALLTRLPGRWLSRQAALSCAAPRRMLTQEQGASGAFMKTRKRDDDRVQPCRDTGTVPTQADAWITDDNEPHPARTGPALAP